LEVNELISGLLDELTTRYEISLYHLKNANSEIGKDRKLQVFRVFQELINNIIKHSKANEITVYLRQSNHFLQLLVQDNGIGFDPEKAKSGLGMKNLELRIRSMNGKYKFKSPSLGGSVFLLSLRLS
jgi:signal transduction histidine kinase